MDSHMLAASLGSGFAIGLTTLLVTTFAMVPASYVMNKFIYHGPVMRLTLGLVAGACSFFAFIVLAVLLVLGRIQPTHYFGLFPVVKTAELSVAPGYLAVLLKILYALYHPFIMFFNPSADDDVRGYTSAVEALLVKGTPVTKSVPHGDDSVPVQVLKGAVCEEFFEAARRAGTMTTKLGSYMHALEESGVGQIIFDSASGTSDTTSAGTSS